MYEKFKILLTNWWNPMSPDIIDKVLDEVPFPGWALEHAAVTETSLIMYFESAKSSSAQRGKIIVDDVV